MPERRSRKGGALWAVLIAGGAGTRFWPASRHKKPKQFLTLFGKKTLLEETFERLGGLIPRSRILVLTAHQNVPDVRRLLRLPRNQVLGEPSARNTAPAALLAASLIHQRDKDAILAILPADHRIQKVKLFQKALRQAARAARQTRMPVTFAIKPAFAHTGYGYLETQKAQGTFCEKGARDLLILRVKRFHEKPGLDKAKSYLKSRRYFWNSGMFVWRAEDLLAAAKKFMPSACSLTRQILTKLSGSRLPSATWNRKIWMRMPNISIDYGLMEPLNGRILAIPVQMGWSDLGGWNAYSEFLPGDRNRNRVNGKLIAIQSGDNMIEVHPSKLVALVGIKGQIIVDTPDALLICAKEQAEQIREIVHSLKQKKLSHYL